MMRYIIYSLLLMLFVSSSARAQLVVENAQTSGNWAPYYVNEVLLGEGVTAFNITFTTDSFQIGEFTSSNTTLNMEDGLIMACGDVELAPGPNSSPGSTTVVPGAQSDPDLFILSGDPINDAAILEFDFVPSGDSVSFNYTFASEEYNEYVGGSVNDAFGFFLSGPGIAGGQGFTNDAVNLAIIPGTSIPVSINSVNLDSNQAYYVDNDSLNTGTIEYDGLTVLLRAEYEVTCGDTYHIKLVIGDGGDEILDSGVFLEGGSFSSTFIDINLDSDNGDSTITEGCGKVDLMFNRDDICYEAEIGLVYSGTAINGVDYPMLPDSIFMEIGQTDTILTIEPFADALNEGPETVTVTATRISYLGDTFVASATFIILDSSQLNIVSTPDTAFTCRPDSFPVYANVLNGGPPPYTYSWSTGQTTDTIWFLPTEGPGIDTLIVQIQDSCELGDHYDTVLIIKDYPEPVHIQAVNDSNVNCTGDSIELEYLLSNGNPPIDVVWSTGDTTNSIIVEVTGYQEIFITATDSCGDVSIDTAYLDIKPPSDISITHADSVRYCKGSELEIIPQVSGGIRPYDYSWDGLTQPFDDDSTYQFIVNRDTTLEFWVEDACGARFGDTFFINAIEVDPINISLADQSSDCAGNEFEIQPLVTGGLRPLSYEWSTGDSDTVITIIASVSQGVGVSVSDICGNRDQSEAIIEVKEYADLELSISADRALCYGEKYTLHAYAKGGAGRYSFDWETSESPLVGEMYEKIDSATYSVKSMQSMDHYISVSDRCGITLADTIRIEVIPCVSIPNVITPNGDGVNDAFYIENITNFTDAHLMIYNRWGQKVFESKPYLNEWVPVDYSSGTYFYILRSANFNELRGNLTVINENE